MSNRSALLIEANMRNFEGDWKIQPISFANGTNTSISESQISLDVPPDKTLLQVNILSVPSNVRGVINLMAPILSGQDGYNKSMANAGQMVAVMMTGNDVAPWRIGARSLLVYDDYSNVNIAELRIPGEFVVLMYSGTGWTVVDWYLNSAAFLITAGYAGRGYCMNRFALQSAEMLLVGAGGGGGGGGYGATSGAGGGGGGSGQLVYLKVPNQIMQDPFYPDVGIGGSGGIASDGVTKGDGEAGGFTEVLLSDVYVRALGGNGGLGSLTTSTGAGGAAVGAAAGGPTSTYSYQTYIGQAGVAGGATTAAGSSGAVATNPTPTGGGGGGGISGTTPRNGGNGGTDSGSLIFARKALGGVAGSDPSGGAKDSVIALTSNMVTAIDNILDICGSGAGGGATDSGGGGYSGGNGGNFGGGGGGGGGGSVSVSTPGWGGGGADGCVLVLPKYRTTPLG